MVSTIRSIQVMRHRYPPASLNASEQAGVSFGWGSEGDGVIEMTGTFTRNAVPNVEGIWMRPSTQVVSLRFRRAAVEGSPSSAEGDTGSRIEGTIDWPEEQASAEFHGRIYISVASPGGSSTEDSSNASGTGQGPCSPEIATLNIEGKVGQVLQGAPERVGWLEGAEIVGKFCKDGTDGTLKGSWTTKATATAIEPLMPGRMRINVGLLPDRLLAAEGAGPADPRTSLSDGAGSSGDLQMGSSCR